MELTGKTALVTGASKRIGRAIAMALAEAGANVIVHCNRSTDAAEATAVDIRAIGVEAHVVRADLSEPDRIEAMFASIERLDVLVNNAAVFDRTPLDELTADQWDAPFAVNARAPALCIRWSLPLLRSAGAGAIVNITDIAAEKAWAAYPAYCASKAALLALTKSAARSLAGENIRVNAVAPGAALWADDQDEKDVQAVIGQIPLKRAGSPEDIAAAVVFLAGHDYMTGQTLRIDGGWHMG